MSLIMAEGALQDPNAWKTQEFRQKIIAKLYLFLLLFWLTISSGWCAIWPPPPHRP